MTARLWDVGRDLHARVRSFFDAPLGPDAAPLELLHAALNEVERKTQASGRGTRTFPYTEVTVHVAQAHADRPALEAVFKHFDERVRERFAELRCDCPATLKTTLEIDDAPQPSAIVLRVTCAGHEGDTAAPPSNGERPTLRLVVVKGVAEPSEYTLAGSGAAIGRGAEPADAFGRVRRNHVAFGDVRDGVTETVGRAHARVEYDATSGGYHLFNESGSNPTFVLRAGRSLRVAPRDPRGVRLQTGDEIQLGRAILRVVIGTEP